jgi:hypothetical protein
MSNNCWGPGELYVAQSCQSPYIIKIGLSNDPPRRMPEISKGTGVMKPYNLTDRVNVPNMKKYENYLHEMYEAFRVNEDREGFGFIPNNIDDEEEVKQCVIKCKMLKKSVSKVFQMLRDSLQQTDHGPNHEPNHEPNHGPYHVPDHGPDHGPDHHLEHEQNIKTMNPFMFGGEITPSGVRKRKQDHEYSQSKNAKKNRERYWNEKEAVEKQRQQNQAYASKKKQKMNNDR